MRVGYNDCPLCGSLKGKRSATCNECRYTNPEVVIWPRVDRSDESGCWPWLGRTDRHGYGLVEFLGTRRAHQATYRVVVGDVPAGLELDHLCRNTSCCNPGHLEAVTHRENLRRSPYMGGWRTKRTPPSHCPAGHPYDAENTWTSKTNKRQCKACNRAGKRAHYHVRRIK